jgi:hypothetical protein
MEYEDEHKTAAQDMAIHPGHPGEAIRQMLRPCPSQADSAAANS